MGLKPKGFAGDLSGSGARPGCEFTVTSVNVRGVMHQGFLNFGPRKRLSETRNMALGFKAIGCCILDQVPWKYFKGSLREALRKYIVRNVVLR